MLHAMRRAGVVVVATSAAALTASMFSGLAAGAELATAEVTGSANDVTVTQGATATSKINVSATGAISCQVTSANPAAARVDTSYALTGGSLSSSSPSAPMSFYSDGLTQGTSGNCGVTWDGGTATPYQVTASFSADAATPVGTYTVRLSAADGTTVATNPNVSGGKLEDAAATAITVHVVAPTSTNSPPQPGVQPANATGDEGSQLSTSGSFTDADGNGTLTVTKVSGAGTVVDNGDGTWSWAYRPADNGSGTVVVQAGDGRATASESFTWTAANVAPTVGALTVGGNGTACIAGNSVTLDLGFTDPGVNDNAWAVDVDWGDGSSHTTYAAAAQGTQPQLSHGYAAGTYGIRVTVTDKDGGAGASAAGQGGVSLLYRSSAILAPFNSDGSSVWKYGATIPVKIAITDCNGTPVGGLAPKVGTSLVSSADPAIAIAEVASTSAADTTGVMRYDAASGQYIYNLGSKYLSDPSATYYVTVKGTDTKGNIVTSAAVVQAKFGLRMK